MSKPNSGWFPKNHPKANELIEEVKEKYGKKIVTNEDVIGIMKDKNGKIIWLENGEHTKRGLAHIIDQHLAQFEQNGISKELLLTFILDVAAYGTIVGYQGKDRPIYEYNYCGKTYYVAITISSNGFIVSANPRPYVKEKERKRK